MTSSYAYLHLAPHWAGDDDRNDILVVRQVDALALLKEGTYEKVAAGATIAQLRRMSRLLERRMSDFLARTTIDMPGGRARSRAQVEREIASYIRDGIFVGLRRMGAERWDDVASIEERRLVREIERDTRGWLWHGGRKYKLVAGLDVDGIPGRDNFEVVRQGEAIKVLDALAAQFAGKGNASKNLADACTKLSPDWRPPFPPKGMVLLRRIGAKPIASTQPEAALSPSQLQALREPKSYQFVWDQPWSQRQWVNLPKSWGVVAFGDTATLTGHVEPREAGQVVTFTLLPDPANPPEATGAALETTTATSDAQGKVQLEMAFPIYPGAKFKIAGKTSSMAAPVESEPITVWRRVYYQVTTMDPAPDGRRFDPPADMISAVEAAFNPVWIELAPGTKNTATTPYKAHLTFAERWALENSLRPSAVDNRSPYKMNIVMVDTADIVAERDWIARCVGPTVETISFVLWPHEPTIISAGYEQSPGVWAPMTNVQIVPAEPGKVKIRASMPGPQPTPVPFRIHYRRQRGNAGGWGGPAGTVFICIGLLRKCWPVTGASLQPTLTHEIGHALGLVPVAAPWHERNPEDKPYGLAHCGSMSADHKPTCVMYKESGNAGVRTRFCNAHAPDDCEHFLLRADLSAIRWI